MFVTDLFGFFWQNSGGKVFKCVIKHRNIFLLTYSYCSECAAKKHLQKYFRNITCICVFMHRESGGESLKVIASFFLTFSM